MNERQLAEFGKRLRRRRDTQGLTRSGLCERARITRTTLRALESVSQHPTAPTLARLALALETTEDALTGEKPIELNDPLLQHLTDEDLEVAQAFHHAPTRVKQRTLGVLQERGRIDNAAGPTASELVKRFLDLEPAQRQLVEMMITELEDRRAAAPEAPRQGDSAKAPQTKIRA